MPFSSARKVQLAFIVGAAVLLAMVIFSVSTVRRFRETNAAVRETNEAQARLMQLLSTLKDIETGSRGYLLAGDESFLVHYHAGRAMFPHLLENAKVALADTPGLRGRLTALEPTLAAKLDVMALVVRVFQEEGQAAAAAIVASARGQRLMDAIRDEFAAIAAEQARLLELRLNASEQESHRTVAALGGGLTLGSFFLGSAYYFMVRDQRAREAASAELTSIVDTVPEPLVILTQELRVNSANRSFFQIFQASPEETIGRPLAELASGAWSNPELLAALKAIVPQHTALTDFEVRHEFPTLGPKVMLLNARKLYRPGNNTTLTLLAIEDITTRTVAADRIAQLHAEATQRAEQLAAANREMESFSYSVSHDLRAPLRHLAGYSQMLEKHAAETLDERGRRYLKVISDTAREMGVLIDELLAFSGIGRASLRRERVSLDALVADVRARLTNENTGRCIIWNVESLPTIEGDATLLRQVFANLLDNAVKYTRERAEARIDISLAADRGSETVVVVRDNGAGFDMKYAHKLFGVFQRLHTAAEFEGNGIGLATVQRILQRHGGRIWAEGEPGVGATFYVSFPSTPLPTGINA